MPVMGSTRLHRPEAGTGSGKATKRRQQMTKILTAIAFALSLGALASTASANELGGKENIANPFPVYTTING
jgi:cell division septation protein DedD